MSFQLVFSLETSKLTELSSSANFLVGKFLYEQKVSGALRGMSCCDPSHLSWVRGESLLPMKKNGEKLIRRNYVVRLRWAGFLSDVTLT